MKVVIWTFIIFIGIILILCLFKGCEPSKPNDLELKTNSSLRIDSIVSASNSLLQVKHDSLVGKLKLESDSIKESNRALSVRYNALRSIVRKLQPVKVDSLTQVVNDVPATAYNASIYSGIMCDSLLIGKDLELNIKDSIISVREIQLDSEKKAYLEKDQALNDLKAFNNLQEKVSEKAKKLNKKIPLIATISAEIGALIALFFALR